MYYSIEITRLLAVILITFTHIRHSFQDGPLGFVLEQVPLYGTLILSIISGFLYAEVTASKPGLLQKKVKSLLIPYLVANISVLFAVLVAAFWGIEILNRLQLDWSLITTGLLALDAPPINPPTYFVRDIFIIFVMIETIRTRNHWLFFGILVFAWFGELLLRYDILVLFIFGVMFSRQQEFFLHKKWILVILLAAAGALLVYYQSIYARHAIATLLFLLMIDWKVRFVNVGGYTYTLHLYHSPVIVVAYPLLLKVTQNPYLLVLLQLSIAYTFCFVLYWAIKHFRLDFVIGGR